MKVLSWAIVAALAATPPAPAIDRSPSFAQLSVDDGLSQNTVTAIAQDAEGFLWFGTRDGLNRFDGYQLRIYRHDPDQHDSLTDSFVTALLADADGRLWVGTLGGLNRFDPAAERCDRQLRYTEAESDRSLSSDHVTALLAGRDGQLWVGTDRGLDRLDPAGGRVEHFRYRPGDAASLASDAVQSLLPDARGGLWVGTYGGGVSYLDGDGQVLRSYRHDPKDPASLSSDQVQVLYRDAAGRLWVGTADAGLNLMGEDGNGFQRFRHQQRNPDSLSHDNVYALVEDEEGALWIATYGGGLDLFDAETGHFTNFRRNRINPLDPFSLSHDFLLCAYRDRSGTVWLGTDGSGAASFSPKRDRFRHYSTNLEQAQSLSHNHVWGFYQEADGDLWVATSGGLDRLDGQRRFHHYRHRPEDPRGLAESFVRALYGTPTGELWIGTMGGGLQRLDPRTDTFTSYRQQPDDPRSLSSNRVLAILPDGTGKLWIGTHGGGLNHFDPRRGTFSRYRHRPGDSNSLGDDLVSALLADGSEGLWIGTQGAGLDRLDLSSGRFEHYRHDPDDASSLSHDRVRSLFRDHQGQLWVGTDRGLNRMQPGGGFQRFEEQPFGSEVVSCILEDGQGDLWLSTSSGLVRFHPQTASAQSFEANDGLRGNRFDTGACFRNAEGELFFGGRYGFQRFRPETIRPNPYTPPVVLTSVRIFDREVPFRRALAAGEPLRLSHRDNTFSFEFAALDFTDPARNRYAYQLEGYDLTWVDAGPERRARYNLVPPGQYTFRVRGTNNDGVWNQAGVALNLVVKPPPWRTPWAYGLYGLALVGAVLTLLRLQEQRLQQRAEDRRKSAELERARVLQLSLLPDRPPRLAHLEIAVHMRTATEVGGDYYDFFPQDDGSLFVAVGDATGHGISAGMMVSMTKIALRSLEIRTPDAILDRLNALLRDMHSGGLMMALCLLHVEGDAITLSSAAMPPVFLLRQGVTEAEEILLPGLPLGGLREARYQQRRIPWAPGDLLVVISDGLPERANPAGELLGYRLVQEALASSRRNTQDVLQALISLGEEWGQGLANQDDVTVVVMRRRLAPPEPGSA